MSNNDKLFDLILQVESVVRIMESMKDVDPDLRVRLDMLRRTAADLKSTVVG